MQSSTPPSADSPEKNVTVRCPGCGVEGKVPTGSNYDCTRCGAILDPEKHQIKPHHVRRGMLDRLTGMRMRRRKSMGFKKAGSAPVSAAHDAELSGRILSKLSADWHETTQQPWEDLSRPEPPARKWLDVKLGPALLGLLLIPVLVFWGWWLWRGDQTGSPPLPARNTDRRATFDKTLDQKVKDAEQIASQFLRAGDVGALLPLVRDRSRVEPAILAWYLNAPPFSATLRGIKLHSAAMLPDSNFLRLLAETEDFRHVVVTLEETPEGWRVDWESFVAWSAVAWSDLAEGRTPDGNPALVRAYLQLADFYEPPFSQETHQSCTLRSPGSPPILPAWMEAAPLSLTRLRGAIFDAGTPEIEVIARVRPMAGGTKGRLEIVEIIQTGWVLWSGSRKYSGVLFKSSRELLPPSANATPAPRQ